MKKGVLKLLLSLIFTVFLFNVDATLVNAAGGNIKVTSNRSSVVVGDTVTVTVKVSSSSSLGTWEYTISYDSSKLKLTSGSPRVVDYYKTSGQKSETYTYKFKAIASGSSTVTVKSYSGYTLNEDKISFSVGSARIKSITQAELEASYSKNNNLSSLEVEGYTLNEAFDKDTLEYTVTVPSDTEKIVLNAKVADKTASVSGLGEFEVSEGENKFTITVTAQNGSTKDYIVKVNVEDLNPIMVTIDGIKYTVVKRGSTLTAPSTYEETTGIINGIEVPAFKSEITNFLLVGLKNEEGLTNLYIYNETKNSYTLYRELKTEGTLLFPTKPKSIPDKYKKVKISINEEEVEVYQYEGVDDFYLIYGINIENNEEGFYEYDVKNNTISRYNDKVINELTIKNENYMLIIIVLGVETIVLLLLLLIVITKKNKRKKYKKRKLDFDKAFEEAETKKERKEK